MPDMRDRHGKRDEVLKVETWQKAALGIFLAAMAFLGFSLLNQPPVWGETGTGAGNVVCGDLLNETGALYTLNASTSIDGSTCFTVTAANVTLDCNGFNVVGNNTGSTYGIYTNQLNTTVRNCNIGNFAAALKTISCALGGSMAFGVNGQAVLNQISQNMSFSGLNIELTNYSIAGTGQCNILWNNSTINKRG